jgi:hypothetical protein
MGKTTCPVSILICGGILLLAYVFTSDDDLELARFKGRPGELSPKARLLMFAGWLLPSYFK